MVRVVQEDIEASSRTGSSRAVEQNVFLVWSGDFHEEAREVSGRVGCPSAGARSDQFPT